MTNFPTSLDNFTNPSGTHLTSNPNVLHSQQHGDANDAIEAIEAVIGANFTSVTSTIDWRLRSLESGNGGGGAANSVTGNIATTQYLSSGLAHTQYLIIDFDRRPIQFVNVSGDTIFGTTNRAPTTGYIKTVSVMISGDTVDRSISFPSGIKVLGVAPTGILAGKVAIANFTSYGPYEGMTVLGYAAEA